MLPPKLHVDKYFLFWCDERRRVRRPFTVRPPYTAPSLNSAFFGAMGVGVLGDPLLCCPLKCAWDKCCLVWCDGGGLPVQPFTVLTPYTAPRFNAACFGAMGVGFLGDAFLCYPPPRLFKMLPVLVRWVQTHLHCVAPTFGLFL